MNSPILITGIPRSGTSLAAGLIHLSGVNFGDTIPGNRNNPKGFFEAAEVRNRIVKPALLGMKRDPMGQKPLPDPALVRKMEIPGLRLKVEEIMDGGSLAGAPITRRAYKEPKLLLIWHPWVAAFPEARWVIVRREEEDILDSVQRTSFMRAYSRREDWRGWLEYHLQRIEELKRSQANWIQFWPQKALDGDWSEVAKLEEFLEIKIPYRKAQEFMEPRFWHSGGHRSLYRTKGGS